MPRTTEDQGSPVSREIDRIVGQTIKTWRRDRGITQAQLAEHLGVSYQQVQKYESGGNRVSAGRLYEIVAFFGREIGEVYTDVPPALENQIEPVDNKIDAEMRELLRNFEGLTNPEVRAAVSGLVRSFSDRQQKRQRRRRRAV